jgi:hypothetical protein
MEPPATLLIGYDRSQVIDGSLFPPVPFLD